MNHHYKLQDTCKRMWMITVYTAKVCETEFTSWEGGKLKSWISLNDKVKETQLSWHQLLISGQNPPAASFSLLTVILERFPSVLSCRLSFRNELYFHYYCSIQKNPWWMTNNHINQGCPNPVRTDCGRARFSVIPMSSPKPGTGF